MEDTLLKLVVNDGVTGLIAYIVITRVDKRLDDFIEEFKGFKKLLKKMARKQGIDVDDED